MSLMKKINSINILFLFKTSVGSTIAILIANRLGLAYGASAGIITLLTIQNTKKETIFIAFRRILAFFVAVITAFVLFSTLGYTTLAFGGFIFIFVALCTVLGLQDGIIMNAVLTTHFLIEKSMDSSLLINEVSLLGVGMGIGIILNLIMPRYDNVIRTKQKVVEDQIKNVLRYMAEVLKGGPMEGNDSSTSYFDNLDIILEKLLSTAYEDAGNRLLWDTKYQISYLEMRKLQIVVLKTMMKNIEQFRTVLPQSIMLSRHIERVAELFHEFNNAEGLLLELKELNESFKNQKLPTSREEFENRAILFQFSRDLEHFLTLKRNFANK